MGLLYTPMKVFHYPEKLAGLPREVDDIKPPLHIRIKPTNVCNHNCWYCAYRAEGLQLGKDMDQKDFIPKDKMMEITDDVIHMGVNAVTFSGGGEPFCYPYLTDVVERMADGHLKFAALTNGSRLNGKAAEIFAHHATWIRVSIDGWDDESYAGYRSVKIGEFTKVMTNMERFKRLNGPCYLGVSFIIDQKNYTHAYDFISKLKDIGVDSVKVSPCIVSNDVLENRRYHQEIFDQVREIVDRALADLHDDAFEIFDAYHQLDHKFDKKYTWCPYIQILPVIGADLNVYSCHDKAYNLDQGLLGSIRDRFFRDLWFSDKNNFFRINPQKDCLHHCCVNSINEMILEYLSADQEHLAFV